MKYFFPFFSCHEKNQLIHVYYVMWPFSWKICMCWRRYWDSSRECVLQCVAVCCSVLQRVAVCCSALQCVAVHESYLALSMKSMHVLGGGDGIHEQSVFR